MDIWDVAFKINALASNYEMAEFQAIRTKLKNLKKVHRHIFSKRSTFDGYAFHFGGRKELQYNIGMEKDPKRFRYGVAFSLERGLSLTDPIGVMKPKIEKYNEFIRSNPTAFPDISFGYYPGQGKNKNYRIRAIDNHLIQDGNFIFIGKYFNKTIQKLNKDDYDEILKTFDRLLPLYYYVESDTTILIKICSIDRPPNLVPGHKPGIKSTKAKFPERESYVELFHNHMLTKSFNQLAKRYGENNVSTKPIGGTKIDLVVKENDSFTFYEFKTTDSIQSCIREALGQLLEYSYYPNQNRARKLIIVSVNKINKESQEYLKKLRGDFNIPIYYKRYNSENDILEEFEY